MLPLLAISCASDSGNLEYKIRNLERELTRLKSERVNLTARATSLDDELVLLKKKLNKCDTPSPAALRIIRLESSELESDSPFETIEETPVTPTAKPSNGQPRPQLTLVGRQSYSYESRPATASRPVVADSSAFSHLDPDNLGVVHREQTQSPGAERSEDGPMELFQSAYRMYTNRQYLPALEQFSSFVQKYPAHDYADNGIFWRGECFLAMGNLFKAIGEFERLMGRYPDSEKIPSCLYRIGFVYDKLRDREKAVEYYFRVVDKYPGSDAARRASRRVAEIDVKTGRGGNLVSTAATR